MADCDFPQPGALIPVAESTAAGPGGAESENARGGPPHLQKKERPEGRSFGSSFGKDYLRILRRRTIAKAPRPSRLIVAGSGTAAVENVAV